MDVQQKKIYKAYLKTNLIDEIMFDVSNTIRTCTKDSEKKKLIELIDKY
jgi:hypothetical protein